MMSKHTILTIVFSALAAGASSAAIELPQYAALLGVLATVLLAAAGKTTSVALHTEPPAKKDGTGPSPVLLILVVTSLLLGGCSRFAHFSDPTLEDIAQGFCDTFGEQHKAELEAQAKQAGLSIDDVMHAFNVACLIRVKQAGPAGMGAVQLKIIGEMQK